MRIVDSGDILRKPGKSVKKQNKELYSRHGNGNVFLYGILILLNKMVNKQCW